MYVDGFQLLRISSHFVYKVRSSLCTVTSLLVGLFTLYLGGDGRLSVQELQYVQEA